MDAGPELAATQRPPRQIYWRMVICSIADQITSYSVGFFSRSETAAAENAIKPQQLRHHTPQHATAIGYEIWRCHAAYNTAAQTIGPTINVARIVVAADNSANRFMTAEAGRVWDGFLQSA